MGNKVTKKTEPSCCEQKDCCQPPADSKQSLSKKQWWKIGVFSLGVCLIIGAASYSLITRHLNASNAPLDSSTVPQIIPGSCASALLSLNISDLAWAQELSSIFADHDFVFVVLPENNTDLAGTLTNRISDATAKIEANGKRVGTFTLNSGDPEFSTTMQRLSLGQLPAVLALSNTGNGAIITGDITEGKLLQTYLTISQPVCAPGSGCCSGK